MGAAPAVAPAARRALNANLGTITNLPSMTIEDLTYGTYGTVGTVGKVLNRHTG